MSAICSSTFYSTHAFHRVRRLAGAHRIFPVLLLCLSPSWGQRPAPSPAPQPGPKISLDQAIALAVQHNHALLAARTQIQQSQAQEITASIRPNPALSLNSLFIPFTGATAASFNQISEFDLGLGYTFELG